MLQLGKYWFKESIMKYIICHYGEIALKGKNRPFFERKLVDNIKKKLDEDKIYSVRRIFGRIIIRFKNEIGERDIENLKKVFGLANFSPAIKVKRDITDIEKKAKKLLKDKKFKTFRITTKRAQKDFPFNSQEINEKVGATIVKGLKKEVDLDNPDLTCFIEIAQDLAFIYTDKIEGAKGLPVGVSGKAISLLSGGIDSPVASFYMLKRGVKPIYVHFHSYPYTDKASINKVKELIEKLKQYQFDTKLYLVPFADFQKRIIDKIKDRYRIVLYRRFMYRIANRIAQKEGAKSIISGDSVGQVASQTLENINAISTVSELPVLRPLIEKDKQEIVNKAKEIGTYKISIQPHEDTCSRFLPDHPETKTKIKNIEKEEENIDIESEIKKIMEGIEIC